MTDLAEISALVQAMHRDVRKLAQIVHEGNGTALVTRVALIERTVEQIELKLGEAATHRWQILLAVVSAFLSLSVSVGLTIINVTR